MSNQRLSIKMLHICIVFVIVVVIIFAAMMFILDYYENGETNMPFKISKISIISTVDGQDVENSEQRWNINVIQNNDIYVYIEKNEEHKKQETISNVKLDNFNIVQNPSIGEMKIYKPTMNENSIFKNSDENIAQEIDFKGSQATDARNLEISNQGGVVGFRCSNNNIGTYISNDDEQINYKDLIQKLNLSQESLMSTLTFDITITLNSGKVFKAFDIRLEVPNENIISEGTVGKELTDLQDIIFKRIEN